MSEIKKSTSGGNGKRRITGSMAGAKPHQRLTVHFQVPDELLRDLQQQIPGEMAQLMNGILNAFVKAAMGPGGRKVVEHALLGDVKIVLDHHPPDNQSG